jgi:Haem-binding uptake, Tiki superfamily, ChaN
VKFSWLLLLPAAALSSCGGWRQPALPKAATIAATPAPDTSGAWAARLRTADVIYFGLTRSATAPGQPIWELVQTLQNGGAAVALGWAELPAPEQPRLEAWKRQEISSAQLLDGLVRPERAPVLRPALRPDLAQVALGAPRLLLAKIRDGGALTAEEEAQLPRGFHAKPDALENFADRIASSARLRRFNFRRLSRAHFVAEQTIAGNVVRFHREHPESKMLVLLPNDSLIDAGEVADFAAQQMPLRQLILDHTEPAREKQPQFVERRYNPPPVLLSKS